MPAPGQAIIAGALAVAIQPIETETFRISPL